MHGGKIMAKLLLTSEHG